MRNENKTNKEQKNMKITREQMIKHLVLCNLDAIDLLVEIANDDFTHSIYNDEFVPETCKRGNLFEEVEHVLRQDEEVA